MPLRKPAERERGRRRRRDATIGKLRAQLAERDAPLPVAADLDVDLTDPARVIAEWAAATLVVPTGILAGQPFQFERWQIAFLRDALADGVREAALTVARKNGKSGLIAAMILCYLCGPLNQPNWRAVCVSLTGALAGELRRQITEIAAASGIAGLVLPFTNTRRMMTPTCWIGNNGARPIRGWAPSRV